MPLAVLALACALLSGSSCRDETAAAPGSSLAVRAQAVEPQTTTVKQALGRIHDRLVEARVRPERHHFRSASDWEAFWRRFSEPPAPTIDFSVHDVVLVLMGTQSSGGYSVRIEDVGAGGTPRASVLYCRPGGDAQVAEVTSPADAVVVTKLATPLEFESVDGRTGQGRCR